MMPTAIPKRYPHDIQELKATLRGKGVDFDALRDPWGTPYETVFFRPRAVLTCWKFAVQGPIASRARQDDFPVATVWRPYFGKNRATRSTGSRRNYFTRTGKYVRDYENPPKKSF